MRGYQSRKTEEPEKQNLVLHISLTHNARDLGDGMTQVAQYVGYIEKLASSLRWVLNEMAGTEREPGQKKGRGAREVELGTPCFNDTWHA